MDPADNLNLIQPVGLVAGCETPCCLGLCYNLNERAPRFLFVRAHRSGEPVVGLGLVNVHRVLPVAAHPQQQLKELRSRRGADAARPARIQRHYRLVHVVPGC